MGWGPGWSTKEGQDGRKHIEGSKEEAPGREKNPRLVDVLTQ